MVSGNFNNLDEKSYQGILEEYRALRAEIIAQFQNRNNLLTFGSATLGILFSVASAVSQNVDFAAANLQGDLNFLRFKAGIIVLAITVPLICSLIIFLWGAYSSRVTKIGHYLMQRENAIYGVVECDETGEKDKLALGWENNLRRNGDNDELRQALAITVIFTAISFTSFVTAQEAAKIVVEKSAMLATQLNWAGIQVFSWLFLLAGFLSGVYRIYKIFQDLRSSSEKQDCQCSRRQVL